MSRRALVTIAAAAAALAAAGAIALATLRASGRDDGRTALVTRGEFRTVVEATGRLEAAVFYEIGPPSVAGQWDYNLTWMIPDGSRVQQGDVVARFDATVIEDQLREHRATLEKTLHEREKAQRDLEVELRQLDLDLVKAEGDLEALGVQLDIPEGLVSSLEIERTRLERDLARRKVDFLREKIGFKKALVASRLDLLDVKKAFAEGKIAYHEEAIAKYEVKAPVAGLVVHVTKGRGERWEVGESVWMMAKILRVADVSTLRAEAAVLEVDAARIAAGQPAEVRVDALPGVAVRSTIAEIGRIVHEKSIQDPTKVFDAFIPIEAAPAPGESAPASASAPAGGGPPARPSGQDATQLRPGMGIHVVIETSRMADALTIPVDAVQLGGGGGPAAATFVEVVAADGDREPRAVTLGPREAGRVVVLAGLAEGERVALGRPPSGPGEDDGGEVARGARRPGLPGPA